MSKKILNVATLGLAGALLGHHGSSDAPANPAAIDKNQTLITPGATQKPRRAAPLTPLGQSQTGASILSDTLGG